MTAGEMVVKTCKITAQYMREIALTEFQALLFRNDISNNEKYKIFKEEMNKAYSKECRNTQRIFGGKSYGGYNTGSAGGAQEVSEKS